jgi:uncharacterized cupin superfamily protein
VLGGAPILRDGEGERRLEPGDVVAFRSGPSGVHTVQGPGRVVVFSAGASGWGEAFVTVYPDSDKIAAAPGVMFRRSDAIDSWLGDASDGPGPARSLRALPGPESPVMNLLAATTETVSGGEPSVHPHVRRARLGPGLGAQTWAATLYELAPSDVTGPYHYEWCREEWLLVLSGMPTLRHPDGEDALSPGHIACFPEGPTGAHQLVNHSDSPARLVVFSSPIDRPMSAFYPDEGRVLIRTSESEGFVFGLSDQVDDYWEGEPGAGALPR